MPFSYRWFTLAIMQVKDTSFADADGYCTMRSGLQINKRRKLKTEVNPCWSCVGFIPLSDGKTVSSSVLTWQLYMFSFYVFIIMAVLSMFFALQWFQ